MTRGQLITDRGGFGYKLPISSISTGGQEGKKEGRTKGRMEGRKEGWKDERKEDDKINFNLTKQLFN